MRKRKILIAISGPFPYGSPYALRTFAFACLCKETKADVVILCDYTSDEKLLDENGVGFFSGFKFYAKRQKPSRFEKLFVAFDYSSRLKSIIRFEKPDLIISSSMYDRFFSVLSIAKREGLPILLESCEWFDPTTFKGHIFSHHYILFTYCWKRCFIKVDGVIAISCVLEKHYSKYVKRVIKIPTILDVVNVPYSLEINTNKISLLFAGTLARTKDSIKPFIQALNYIPEHANKFEFQICGVSLKTLKGHLGEDLFAKYQERIKCFGIIPQERINELYRCNDFGFFIRPQQRSSHAGFSTKLGEGMSAGTPFIVNNTSDISLYIEDGINGFITKDDSPEEIAGVYEKILRMSPEERISMRREARKAAETYFNYAAYVAKFKSFLNDFVNE